MVKTIMMNNNFKTEVMCVRVWFIWIKSKLHSVYMCKYYAMQHHYRIELKTINYNRKTLIMTK